MKFPLFYVISCMSYLYAHDLMPSYDIQKLLELERTSVISYDLNKIINKCIDSSSLNAEKIEKILDSDQISELCYVSHFFREVGRSRAYLQVELRDKTFTAWLTNNSRIFEDLVIGGSLHPQNLSVLYKIWLLNSKNLSPIEINMALGASLIANKFTIEESIAKFTFYKKSYDNGQCYPQSDSLLPWEWAIVMGGGESLEDLKWAQEYVLNKNIKAEDAGSKFLGFIPYRLKNSKGISIHAGGAFYDYKKISLQLYTEYGGVCGAVSKGAAGFLRSKGVPAFTIGQPRHCAFIWKHPNGTWIIGNNISGWNWSNGNSPTPWQKDVKLIPLYNSFIKYRNSKQSMLLFFLAGISQKKDNVEFLLKKACELNPYNGLAWIRYLEIKTKKSTDHEKFLFLSELAELLPSEHNFIDYVSKNILNIKVDSEFFYKMNSCLLVNNNSKEAQELHVINIWNKLCSKCPEMKKMISYRDGDNLHFLRRFIKQSLNFRWTQKTKKRVNEVFINAIIASVPSEVVCKSFIEAYGELLLIWKEPTFRKDALLIFYSNEEMKDNVKMMNLINKLKTTK